MSKKLFGEVNIVAHAMKPRTADFLMTMNLGENYSKKLSSFINKNFDIIDFTCSDNDVIKEFNGLTSDGEIHISLKLCAINNNEIVLSNGNTSITKHYDGFSSFDTILKEFEDELK